jgi:hypothetical protein
LSKRARNAMETRYVVFSRIGADDVPWSPLIIEVDACGELRKCALTRGLSHKITVNQHSMGQIFGSRSENSRSARHFHFGKLSPFPNSFNLGATADSEYPSEKSSGRGFLLSDQPVACCSRAPTPA